MTQDEINNFADKIYHAKMEEIPTILEELVKIVQSKMYSEEDMFNFANYCMSNTNPYNTPKIFSLEKWKETIKNK